MKTTMHAAGLAAVLLFGVSTPGLAQTVIPHVNDTRLGGQLIFYYDLVRYDAVFTTWVNTGLSSVPLHVQIYGSDCQELLNFRVTLPAGCVKVYDLRRFELPSGVRLDLAGLQGLIVATPVGASPSFAAVPYNHLAGNSVHAGIASGNSFGLNAVARLAVDSSGAPLADFSTILDGTTGLLQTIQPTRLINDGFFALDTVSSSRLILISFRDNYTGSGYFLSPAAVTLSAAAGNSNCLRLSLPSRDVGCILNISLQDLLGQALDPFRNAAGWLELNPSLGAGQNLLGIASQTLGTYTVNRYLWAR